MLEVDAAENNLWFLRRLGGEYGRVPDPTADYGVVDPEDIQPLKLKEYFLCYLSSEPEPCVREKLQRLPEISARANRYLAHQELQRIAVIADPAIRVERALPYWLEKKFGALQFEAQKILESAGTIAGPYLVSVYEDQTRPEMRERVIELWGGLRYPGCVEP